MRSVHRLSLPRNRSGGAVGAVAVDVDGVMSRREALGARHPVERRVERALEAWGERDVADQPAVLTDEVVVVLSQVLGELVVRVRRRRGRDAGRCRPPP